MKLLRMFIANIFWICACCVIVGSARADSGMAALPDTIVRIKPSIVGIGTFQKTRRPPAIIRGTGFAVGDGRYVMTNAHVIPEKIDEKHNEVIAVFTSQEEKGTIRSARIVGMDREHDLCFLAIEGEPLSPLSLGDDSRVREGEVYAFTGYPLGAILGLNAVTHRGIISAITPIVIPANRGGQLSSDIIDHLKQPYSVFQLDCTAYPGNSGSPLFNMETGEVIGIINMVFVKGIKEHAITDPSGITFAIPVKYGKKLLNELNKD